MNIACHIRNDTVYEHVRSALARAGFLCERFPSEIILMRAIRRRDFDFIMVDIGCESQASDSILSWLNCRTGDSTPVLVLSPVHTAELAADALDAGADDFVSRQFEAVELIARIRAVLRRAHKNPARRMIELAGFELDREASRFAFRGTPIELTPREFTMAWLLFSSPGEFVSRETIGTAIWGVGSKIAGRTIEQHVYKLRKKLQLGDERGVIIRTAYNKGYRLELMDGGYGAPSAVMPEFTVHALGMPPTPSASAGIEAGHQEN